MGGALDGAAAGSSEITCCSKSRSVDRVLHTLFAGGHHAEVHGQTSKPEQHRQAEGHQYRNGALFTASQS